MTKIPLRPASAALALAAVALLAACGSTKTDTVTVTQTQTVTASATHTSTTATSTTVAPTTSTSSSSTSATATTPTATTTTSTTTTTRTSTGPAFVTPPPTPTGALGAAVALLARKGYTPVATSSYRAGDTLRVLIGRASGGERAFFFDQGTYLGTDASAASGQIAVLATDDTQVTLSYATYRAGASSASGQRRVRFALDMGRLAAVDPIPSVAIRR